tara:strand:+ start:17635 stop:18717 length:1083 start_codon:yes stop_codon:yes gene_type:complete
MSPPKIQSPETERNESKLKAVLFLGDQSGFGIAHLEPLLENFDVELTIFADKKRWAIFREALTKDYATSSHLKPTWKLWLEQIKSSIRFWIRRQKTINLLKRYNIKYTTAHSINAESFRNAIARKYDQTIFFCAAFPQIFGAELLAIPKHGTINFHPSVLPKFRGAHPHYWMIARGEKIGGISAHYMTPRLDDGNLLAQTSFPIDGYYYSDLYARIVRETPDLVLKLRQLLEGGRSRGSPQDEALSTSYKNDRDIHHRIFWQEMTSLEIFNLIRTERAFCFFRGNKIGLRQATTTESNRNLTNAVRIEPGTVIDIDQYGVYVSTRNCVIQIIQTTSKHGRQIPAVRWASRAKLAIGEKFE